MVELDVILPVYNCPDLEDRCIRFLLTPGAMPEGARLIVVDDASPDTTTAERWGPALRALGHCFYRRTVNGGCHAAWNTGLSMRRAGADVCLIGSDVVVPIGVIPRLQTLMRATDFSLMGAFDLTGQWEPALMKPLVVHQRPENVIDTNGAISSCCVIRSEAFDTVGLFDEQFIRTFGDTDWNTRFEDAGLQHAQLQSAVVFHGGSVSRKRQTAEKDFELDRADHERFRAKWADRPDVLEKHSMIDADAALLAKKGFWTEGEQ
jgi:GT2 family glycosyltransferase